jgi:hypothetical protein
MCLEGLRKTITNISQDSRCPGKIRTQTLPNAIQKNSNSLGKSDYTPQLISKLYYDDYYYYHHHHHHLRKNILTNFSLTIFSPADVQLKKLINYKMAVSAEGRM